jgi:fucose permease
MGSQIAAAYTGVMITPPLFGLVANWFGIRSFPVFLLVLFGMMSVFTFLFLQKIRQQGKFRSDV